MKLESKVLEGHHGDLVASCIWSTTGEGELITCSDDKTMKRLSPDDMTGETILSDLDYYVTDLSLCPNLNDNTEKNSSFIMAASCSDGSLRILQGIGSGSNTNIREEKKVENAHKGCAVICIKWNLDGTALATGGEDGSVKIWSRVGMLRNTVASTRSPIYSLSWGRSDTLLFANGKNLIIEQKERDKKQLQWKAHDGIILCCDWNPVTTLIVSGGEDCKYRIWDSFGRQLFQCQPLEHVITSVAWSPNGSCFAVGSYNTIRLCDKTGWSYCSENFGESDNPVKKLSETGSILKLTWSLDGTMVGGAGANGSVVTSQIINRELEWKHTVALVLDSRRIEIQDSLQDVCEVLEFRDTVLDISLAWEHLIVYTSAPQVQVYNLYNLNAPHIFDVSTKRSSVLIQSSKYILGGWGVYTYEGRRVCGAQAFNGINVQLLDKQTVAMNDSTIAVLENSRSGIRTINLKKQHELTSIQHKLEILQVTLSSHAHDILAFIDSNRDVFIHQKNFRTFKLPTTSVQSICFNDQSDMLAACVDGGNKLIVWEYPQVVWIDPDLLSDTTTEKDTPQFSSQQPHLVSFWQNSIVVRKQDGSVATMTVPPYSAMLHQLVIQQRKWEDAIRLCRFVHSKSLWATLAAMAIQQPHLDTAEIALAATGHVDKLEYILYIKDIPSEKARMAELSLYKRDFAAAEKILLHSNPPMLYRAIKMNIRFFRWDRAIQLAKKDKNLTRIVEIYKQQWRNQEIDDAVAKEFLQLKNMFRETRAYEEDHDNCENNGAGETKFEDQEESQSVEIEKDDDESKY